MNKLKYGLLIVGIVCGLSACDDDNDYEYIPKLPRGGFLEKTSDQSADYFISDAENVAVPMQMNRMKAGQNLTVKLDVSIEPAELSSAIGILKNEVAFKGSEKITPELFSIDWSKVPAGKSLTVTAKLQEADDIDLNTICASYQMNVSKAALPIPWCDPQGVGEVMLDFDATAPKKVSLALLSMTKAAVQDLVVPFKLETDLVEGTDFKILGEYGHAFFVPAGERSASIEVEVRGDLFPQVGFERVKLTLTEEGKNPSQLFEYDPAWKETWLKIGRSPDYVMILDPNAEYEALLAAGEGNKEFTITIPNVLDKAAARNMTIPLNLNQYMAKLGIHFQMDAPYQMTVQQGSRDAQVVLTVLSDAFASSDDNVPLYIELADPSDAVNFWTTITLGRE
ncbi:hypothetical protein [Culturomica massiliensis]|mgnify:FL=1|uniref:hypothetical protein n=1 Tax=Culturomica massiliensis TaxID=1841857 RepID=UPI0008383381|nr:hypothetical protein [Culturomica massiliensis]